jgi:transposase-like protein
MTKSTRARYMLEFKEEAVRLVTGGERVATVARNLGLSEQTLHNWVKAAGRGGLKSSATPAVSAEQMEISRLRTELSRVKMERDILKPSRLGFPPVTRETVDVTMAGGGERP